MSGLKLDVMAYKSVKTIGPPGYRSQCLPHAKRALYHLS
ncbi:hypothetical protein T4B_6391 [Trichinella pseudospiralis]|uniref:Uncharacterized protein n=1 Tax=Trichinella pseudospiralis TaxID=6337 RepID=A0A0V1KDV1_TRIPS|nr:hypothetical protein T4B_6391 [Trichinella pseudospiralis]KRZ45389.1 hypothetical protein T4C_13381 [Trichinella pseudospiralis]